MLLVLQGVSCAGWARFVSGVLFQIEICPENQGQVYLTLQVAILDVECAQRGEHHPAGFLEPARSAVREFCNCVPFEAVSSALAEAPNAGNTPTAANTRVAAKQALHNAMQAVLINKSHFIYLAPH
jgi:hypothetical protein